MTTFEKIETSRRLNRRYWNQIISAGIAFYREYVERRLYGVAECQLYRIRDNLAARRQFKYFVEPSKED